MLRVSVSMLDMFRTFRDDEDFPLDVFLAALRGEGERTSAMMRGGAFAKAMEHAELGEISVLTADGHAFAFNCDAEIEAWPRREEKKEKDYGGVIVSARCDRVMGKIIADDKTTSQFDAESYMDKFQWRFYLDMWEADVFRWHVWEVREVKTQVPDVNCWDVYNHHLLTQYRYNGLADDCRKLALDFKEFAQQVGWEGKERA